MSKFKAKSSSNSATAGDDNDAGDFEQLNKAQRIKAALYYGIKQISKEVEEEMEVSINSQVLACLSECLNRQIESYAYDMELFAKHAKRSMVNVDDIKLLVRKNPVLLTHVEELAGEYASEREATKKQKKTTSTSSDKRKAGTSSKDPNS